MLIIRLARQDKYPGEWPDYAPAASATELGQPPADFHTWSVERRHAYVFEGQ